MNEYNYYSDPFADQGAKNREAAYLQNIIDTAHEKLNRLEGNPDTQAPQRTWSYYENLRKTNRYLYNDPKTTTQMMKDRLELGEAFMDGDFDKNLGQPGIPL